ncbi:MAG TPA: substrate-binding domain-containing protein [Flavobacterium sp.]|nr:substrate-binding domain-containing protein [Flavobacterium sp.]
MTTIKIAGVPEHFNLPWHLGIENGDFEAEDINLEWTDVPEGTGKLNQMLRSGETDIAIILTEGIIKDILGGNPSKIIQVYVESPLIWGIHVAAKSSYSSLADLKNKKAAISRIGSGSQLMAYVNAEQQGWDTQDLQFEIVNTIDGAVEALTDGTAAYFMWEHFMTKPLVDKGIFRRIADCPSPWFSFVIAATDIILKQNPEVISKILKVITHETQKFKTIPDIDKTLALRYNQKREDIAEWLSSTRWSQEPLTKKMVDDVQDQLLHFKIIEKKGTFDTIAKSL